MHLLYFCLKENKNEESVFNKHVHVKRKCLSGGPFSHSAAVRNKTLHKVMLMGFFLSVIIPLFFI